MGGNDNQQPIIVKRIKKNEAGAHGGAWKLAYADFMTAMMAFFLLMWLLGSTAKGDLKGIADFFQNPLKLSMEGGAGAGSSVSPISGGGTDLRKIVGEMTRMENKKPREIKGVDSIQEKSVPRGAEEAEALKEKIERAALQDVKSKLEAVIEASPELRIFKKQLLLDITSEGLRIQIVDELNRPMFDSGSAEMKPYTKEIVRSIARVLNSVENRISISGHTDAAVFSGVGKNFSNWELSANRSNSCRRELVFGGLEEQKIMRVVGLASSIPLDKNDPFNAINRRITLVVMNKRTELSILNEGRDVYVN